MNLFEAIDSDDIEEVKECVEFGADVNVSNSANKFPLQIAIELELKDIALYLSNNNK